ncbi:MAG: type IV pilus twitching motility protein PilT [Planctomycetes bacterium]|nr:type IV pilus twitching motility protein PilT [Planctomycetota bacterium]
MPTASELMDLAARLGASDIHITVGRAPVMRIHGDLRSAKEGASLTPTDTEALVRELCPERAWNELEERGTADFGLAHKDGVRFRVSVLRSKGAYGAVLRQIPNRLLSFEEIGLPEGVRELLDRPRGLILVTGPTGSGKTTTLATMIDTINQTIDRHVVTIEDPIEYYHQHKMSVITQREIGVDVPDFPEAMRRVLRQDPDVILVGEMRDPETISAAITAAETGHLVFGTLHTTGSARTVDRIIDSYPPAQQEQIRAQLSVSLIAVISQVLMPRKEGRGRVAGFEIMTMIPAIENHIRKNETFKIVSAIQTNRRLGMILLDDFLFELVQKGSITPETAVGYAQQPRDLAGRLGL